MIHSSSRSSHSYGVYLYIDPGVDPEVFKGEEGHPRPFGAIFAFQIPGANPGGVKCIQGGIQDFGKENDAFYYLTDTRTPPFRNPVSTPEYI